MSFHQGMTPIADKYSNPLSPSFMAKLQHMTTEELTDLYQREAANPSGDIRLTVILGMLKERQDMPKELAQMPSSTVAQDVVAQATPRPAMPAMPMQAQPEAAPQPQQPVMSAAQGGLAELHVPDHMFQEHNMASGGIVAFDGGGHVPRYNGDTADESLVANTETVPDWMYEQGLEEPLISPDTLLLGPVVRGTQLAGRGIQALGRNIFQNLARGRYARTGPNMGGKPWMIEATPSQVAKGVAKDVAMFPAKHPLATTVAAGAVPAVASLFDSGDGKTAPRPPANKQPMSPEQAAAVLNKNSEILNQGIASVKNRTSPPAAPGTKPAIPQQGLQVPTDDDILSQTNRFTDRFFGKAPKGMSYDEAKNETMQHLKEFGFDPELISKQNADLEKSRKKLGDDKAFSTNMRIIEAGLGIMGGKSRNFFSNLSGAMPALKGFGEDINRITALDRDIDKEQRNLSVEQNKLAQGLAGASEAKVQRAEDKLADYQKNRGTLAGNIFHGLHSDATSHANAVLQAKSAAAGHAVTKDYYDYLKSQGNQKNIDLIIDNIDKARDPKRWENVIRDSQITSTDPIMVAKRNAALEQLRQRDLEVKANISLLPLELQRMYGVGGGGGGTPGHPALKYGG